MTVVIVILNFNGKHFLSRFLPGVIKYSQPHRIIVADNGSTDGSVELLKNEFTNVDLIEISDNKGYTGGYNFTLKDLKEDIFVLLNSDVEVTPNWVDPVVKMMDEDQNIAACQPKLLSYSEKSKFEYAGAAGGFIDNLGFPFCRGRIFSEMEVDTGQYDDSRDIFWATGACMFVRGDLFKSLEGFDEDFFAHMEEVDLCWRFQNAGYKICVNGQSSVFHIGGGTLSASNPKKTYFNFRNGLTMLVKNEKPGSLWWKLPVRSLFDGLALIKFTFADSWKDGMAIMKAHSYFWFNLGKILRKRREAKKAWKKSENPSQIYRGSIVIDYYLRSIRKFSDLKF